LTKDEVNAISIALSREASDSKSKYGICLRDDVELSEPQNATKLGDLLQLAYFVILNIQPFSQGNNFLGKLFFLMCFLENQALLKLIKEVFGLIKSSLEFLIG
jgi:hypothetical protein